MPKLKKKSSAKKREEEKERKKRSRKEKQTRDAEQLADTEARRKARENTDRRNAEQFADTEARRRAREDADRRRAEQSADTAARQRAREDAERRKLEQSANTAAHKKTRNDPQRRENEQAANTSWRQKTRTKPAIKERDTQNKRDNRSAKAKKLKSDYSSVLEEFRKRIKSSPTIICSCCGGLWHVESTVPTSHEKLLNGGCTNEFIDAVLNFDQPFHRLCSTCQGSVKKQNIPKMCLTNGFAFPEIPEDLQGLSPLEERLVSPRLPFMQIRLLGSERQSVLKGNVVNVESDLNICAKVLPREFRDTSTIQVQLMRRMRYTVPYMYETIRPARVYKAAKYLLTTPMYQAENIVLSEEWSRSQDDETLDFICDSSEQRPGEDANDAENPESDIPENTTEEINIMGAEETLIFSERSTVRKYVGVRIAPAEGNTPTALHRDNNAEVLSFPTIYCGMEQKFKKGLKVTYTDIAKSQLRNHDRRACLPSKVLYSFKRSFNEKVVQAINICLRKTTKNNETLTASKVLNVDAVRHLLESDDGYAVFKNLRSSPSYWKEKQKTAFAMMRQLGQPALFITLSAAETKWVELIIMLHKLLKHEDITEDYVSEMTFNEIAELIRRDPVTCMRHFEYRLRQLKKLLFKLEGGIFDPYLLEDFFCRLEFQMRGSPHEHGLYWLKGAPVYVEDDEDSINACVEFIDQFITCERNEEGEMEKLIGYQLHKHSHTCKKRNNNCRFGFPKPPLDYTRILTPLPKEFDTKSKKVAVTLYAKVKAKLEEFGRSFKEDIPFDIFLESLDMSYVDYIVALRSSIKRTTVFHKRSTNAVFINPYNRKLLEAWGANIDVQFIIDKYACAKYCVSYILKGEGGVSRLLQALSQDVKRGNVAPREQVRKFASILINGSEISAQEATAFLLGLPNTDASRQDIFINTGLPGERTRILKSKEELEQLPEDSEDICCKNIVDHYTARPKELETATLAEFASWYEFSKSQPGLRSKWHKLMDDSGYIRKRTFGRIIRYRHYGKKQDVKNYCREQLMLFIPWRDEDRELLVDNIVQKAETLQAEILENSKEFIFNTDFDDDVWADLLNEIEEEQLLEDDAPLIDQDLETLENQESFDDFTEDIPSKGGKVQNFLPPRLIDEPQYLNMMRSLNQKQRKFVLHVLHLLKTSDQPFYHFLSGGAGVGKSHVITAIVQSYLRYFYQQPNTNCDQPCVIVSAPTGKAAFNVFGMTLHCTFKLPPTQHGGQLCNLEEGAVNSLRSKLLNAKLFIIDEISMVSVRQLYEIDQRLRQIFCTDQDFGGKSVIVVGHMRQLPPIGGSHVFKDPRHLPLGQLVGNHLWEKFELFELDEIMRQRDDLFFCKALNNMSEGVMDDDDIALMKSRQVSEINQPPPEAIHLFQTNEECKAFNEDIHATLDTEGIMSTAYDRIEGPGTQEQKEALKEYAKTLNVQKTDGLPYETHLQVKGQYFVSTNIDVPDGLFNGSTGTLKHIEYGETAEKVRVPICCWMDFGNPLIGIQAKNKKRNYQQSKRINLDWVPVEQMKKNLSKTQRHGALQIIRKQIPLIGANGMTIPKAQGSTMKYGVVHLNKYQKAQSVTGAKVSRGRKLTRESLYVACSRPTSSNGLFIVGEFIPPDRPPLSDPVTLEMDRLRKIPFRFSTKFLSDYDHNWNKIFFHNVQSFIAHHPDLLADQQCQHSDILALVEPHLFDSDILSVPNFSILHRTNCQGTAIRNSEGALVLKKTDDQIPSLITQYYAGKSHCLFVKFRVSNMNVVMVYKSPNYPVVKFTNELSEFLKIIQGEVIVFGDININLINQERNPFVTALETMGFKSLLDFAIPSTDHGSQIDFCFSNSNKVCAWLYESYYSLHKPIYIVWPKLEDF